MQRKKRATRTHQGSDNIGQPVSRVSSGVASVSQIRLHTLAEKERKGHLAKKKGNEEAEGKDNDDRPRIHLNLSAAIRNTMFFSDQAHLLFPDQIRSVGDKVSVGVKQHLQVTSGCQCNAWSMFNEHEHCSCKTGSFDRLHQIILNHKRFGCGKDM